jgi:gamma-glutamyltranspeptidase/glutathione hydrolase
MTMQSNVAPSGMAVTPHHLASESALSVLRHGGDAIEAMIAAAATIAVVYPHMNGIGGDGFWLIVPPEGAPSPLTPAAPPGNWRHVISIAGIAIFPIVARWRRSRFPAR